MTGSLVAGLVAGHLVVSGRPEAVPGLAVVLLPVVLWRRPEVAPAVLVVAALAIEQFGYTVGPRGGAVTASIPLFHGLGNLRVNPADLLLLTLFAIYFAKRATGATGPWPRSAISVAVLGVVAAVLVGLAVGIAHGGQTRVALMETRPYVYLAATYVLASVLVTRREAIRAVLWGVIVASAFKAAQGLVIFLEVRHLQPRPEFVLGHEQALFFALPILLAVALWLFEVRGPLRTTATLVVPLVLAADLANTRRAAWLVLGVGLVALMVLGFASLPSRRRFIGGLLAAIALGAAIYLPAYWGRTGGLAQPARAIRSFVAPDPRDASSDLYRLQEDANLQLNIEEGGVLGKGFGVPIDYVLPIEDISDIDPLIAYVPHNGVLYILMRMGVLGAIAFWALLATGIIAGCRLARSADRELAVVGAFIVCTLVAYTFMGHTDQGFFFYRIAFVVGSLLGLTEAAIRLRDRNPVPRAHRGSPRPSVP